MLEVLEVAMGQGFSKDVCSVVHGAHVCEGHSAILNKLADSMELDMDVFDIRMADVVFHQASCGVVIA